MMGQSRRQTLDPAAHGPTTTDCWHDSAAAANKQQRGAPSELKVCTSMPTKRPGACLREPQHPPVSRDARIGTGPAVLGASGDALGASTGLRPKSRIRLFTRTLKR